MKIVINTCYGGFGINSKWCMKNCEEGCCREDLRKCRECAKLIRAIEEGENVDDNFSKLAVVEFPNEATDYELLEYDGIESLLYVLDGKIRYA